MVNSQDTSHFVDSDDDEIGLEGLYAWDGGGASLALMWNRDYSGKYDFGPYKGVDRLEAFYVNPALAHSFGDWSLHLEAMLGWGHYYDMNPNKPEIRREKAVGYAFYGDVDYTTGRAT